MKNIIKISVVLLLSLSIIKFAASVELPQSSKDFPKPITLNGGWNLYVKEGQNPIEKALVKGKVNFSQIRAMHANGEYYASVEEAYKKSAPVNVTNTYSYMPARGELTNSEGIASFGFYFTASTSYDLYYIPCEIEVSKNGYINKKKIIYTQFITKTHGGSQAEIIQLKPLLK